MTHEELQDYIGKTVEDIVSLTPRMTAVHFTDGASLLIVGDVFHGRETAPQPEEHCNG